MLTLKDFLWPTWAKKSVRKKVGYFYIVILDTCPCIRVPTSPGWMFMVECWGLIEERKKPGHTILIFQLLIVHSKKISSVSFLNSCTCQNKIFVIQGTVAHTFVRKGRQNQQQRKKSCSSFNKSHIRSKYQTTFKCWYLGPLSNMDPFAEWQTNKTH